MDHYQFLFEATTEANKDILIALLAGIGFEGFEEDNNQLKAFIKTGDLSETDFAEVIKVTGTSWSRSTIEPSNWNQIWESGFEPITVNDPLTHIPFATVRAHFHPADLHAVHDIIITPKMSFGTGHHATTYLMIAQMSQLDFFGKRVIDFGTGTGVLAILAEKLGAADLTAIDNDDWSIENAIENIRTNNCTKITLIKAETIDGAPAADIILANINLNIILLNMDRIRKSCHPGAIVLFSGILAADESVLSTALIDNSFSITNIVNKNNWLLIVAKC